MFTMTQRKRRVTLEWKRATRSRTGSREWKTKDERYMVTACECCYDIKLVPVIYSAWFRDTYRDLDHTFSSWRRLSKHRTRQAAEAACAKHDNRRRKEDA